MSKKAIITYTKGRHYKIKLRGKRRAGGRIAMYLDEYLGTKLVDGKNKTLRKLEYLSINLRENPKTPEERVENNNNLTLAESIRSKREEAKLTKGTSLVSSHLKNINFIDYFQNHYDTYPNKDGRLVRACLKYFKEFTSDAYLKPIEVDEALVIDFKRYLEKNLNGDTPYNYFTKFKALCKKANKERLLMYNPAEDISIARAEGLKKEILSFDEIALLPGTHCGNDQVKMAFLFSLNTGLRGVDIRNLVWKNIDLDRAQLRKRQPKVKSSRKVIVTIDLNANAMEILNLREKGDPNDKVFTLPTTDGTNGVLRRWIGRAGISKHITFHCARHTFATNLLIGNANIKTVSGLLGHASLKHTEKYLHLVDELKRKAVDSLPTIELVNIKN